MIPGPSPHLAMDLPSKLRNLNLSFDSHIALLIFELMAVRIAESNCCAYFTNDPPNVWHDAPQTTAS
jgi:hypothetical protein